MCPPLSPIDIKIKISGNNEHNDTILIEQNINDNKKYKFHNDKINFTSFTEVTSSLKNSIKAI